MQEIKLRDEFIKLGQALKAAGLVGSGVNGETEYQRGKKLYDGDVVTFEGETIHIVK